MTILDEILGHKREEVAEAKRRVAPAEMAALADARDEPARGFRETLRRAPPPRIVAEIKRRSPSRGEIRAELDPVGCAKAYAEAGAAAISVLTDERYFGGHVGHLEPVRRAVTLPLLRKDFVIDPYQIDEARAYGADAVLLIVAGLAPGSLAELRAHAAARGLDALVEVHDESELDAALEAGADLIGINNRDLRSFTVDLAVSERLAPRVPRAALSVAESGIAVPADLARLSRAGVHAFLVGESLMRERDPGRALAALRGNS